MRRLFATVGAFGLAAGVALGGPDPASLTPAPSAAELVLRLGSEDFREREQAVAALEKAGASAIPALQEAARSPDPEIRHRAAPILRKLQQAADSATRLAPKRISLHYKDVPLGTALNDLKRLSGLNITFDPTRVADPLRPVTCVTGEVPVWEALDAFCAAASLQEVFPLDLAVPKVKIAGRRGYAPPPPLTSAETTPIVLIDGKATRLPGTRSTAVRILVLPPSFPGHRVTLGTGETTLCLDITPAPGLHWQDVAAVKITKLFDEAGRPGGGGSVPPTPEDLTDADIVVAWGGPGGGLGRGFAMNGRFDPRTGAPIYPETVPNPRIVAVPLKIATPTARSLKRLEGLILGEVVLPNESLVTVFDPCKHAGLSFDGAAHLRLTVESATEAKDGRTTMQLLLQYPSPWSVGARRGLNPGGLWPEVPDSRNAMPSVQCFDAVGKALTATARGGYTDSSADGLLLLQHIELSFPKNAGKPAKLVVIGSRPTIVEVPFVLENVPLP